MKRLLLTTIAAVLLVGCASIDPGADAQSNLELAKESLLVDTPKVVVSKDRKSVV